MNIATTKARLETAVAETTSAIRKFRDFQFCDAIRNARVELSVAMEVGTKEDQVAAHEALWPLNAKLRGFKDDQGKRRNSLRSRIRRINVEDMTDEEFENILPIIQRGNSVAAGLIF